MNTKLIILGICTAMLFFACQKDFYEEPPEDQPTEKIQFVSLTASKTYVAVWDTVFLAATAIGDSLQYK